ncbi:MAG: IS4 family transposase, partial [Cyanothece sp. SIO2G6]|nr:IS4 family transposase [Cyanothece sp. SIO2G6]
MLSPEWQALHERFSHIWIADGSTLEAVCQRLKIRCAAAESRLGGRMMMIVEMMTLRPVQMQYEINPLSNDKIHSDWLLSQLPKGGLLVFELGFFKFAFFDAFTNSQRFFVTRLREKT